MPCGFCGPGRGRIGGPGGGGRAEGGSVAEETAAARSRARRAKCPPAGVDGKRPSGSQTTGASGLSSAMAAVRWIFKPVRVPEGKAQK